MRIVEYDKETAPAPDQGVKIVGIVAGVFSLVLCILIIANQVSLKTADPIHSPALLRLLEELKTNPQDEELKLKIRELDYLARRAFFSSERFNRLSVYTLLGSLTVMVIAFKTVEARQSRPPYPDSRDAKEDMAANARYARWAVTSAGLTLVGVALALALPWKSPLDAMESNRLASETRPEGNILGEGAVGPPGPERPSREEMLKHWPSFLGGMGGRSRVDKLPLRWNGGTGEGVRWSAEVPKPGMGSPIVWENRIFLSGGDKESREILCFALDDGTLLWRREIKDVPGSPTQLPRVSPDTGFAAPTMATDGLLVFALFATGDLAALDFDGAEIWKKHIGVPENAYGHGSSLVTFDGLVLVQFDHEGKGAFLGLEAATGEARWTVQRDVGPSWATPLVVEAEGKPQVILAAPVVTSHDPRTGEELWRLNCLQDGEVAPSPVFANGMVYVSADYVGLFAIDIKTGYIVWQVDDLMPGVGSPAIVNNLLIYGLGDGGIICRNAVTGEELWHEETLQGFYASPVSAGEKVYLIDLTGVTHIVSASQHFERLAALELGEDVVATPAVMGGSLIVRGTKNLFRIDP